jgi:hypothetical protein
MKTIRARISALERLIEHLDTERLGELREQHRLQSRIDNGTATSAELDQYFAARLAKERERLVEGAMSNAPRGRFAISEHRDDRRPVGLAIELLVADSTAKQREEHHRALVAMAATCPAEPLETGDRRDQWLEANLMLRVLGENHGETLRASIADEVEVEFDRWAQLEKERRDAINNGTAQWMDFYLEFRDRVGTDQPLVRAEALRRAIARENGNPLPVGDTPFDWVAEIASHPELYTGHPFEAPELKEAIRLIKDACQQGVPAHHPGHDRWLDAWRWHDALGGGMGPKLRNEIAATMAKRSEAQ